MARVTVDVSMSLDGFVAGPNDSPENPLGDGGERLHEWMFDLASFRRRHGQEGGVANRDDEIVEESFGNVGAWIIGRRMFSNEDGPWGDSPFEGHWGENPPFNVPVFVLTHHPREPLELAGGTTFTFVTGDIAEALTLAREAAGGEDIRVGGGATTIRQFLHAGYLDQLDVHLVPVLLGSGIRLFESPHSEQIELDLTRVVDSPTVTHLRYRTAD